jgi:two-component system chemotaxis sensor kinase CheA
MSTDDGLDNMDDMVAMFFAEARDMLQQIENALLALESDPHDQDTINALFRVAHTIKGSAGMFGMDRVVHFTHQVESVLDRVRNGDLVIDMALSDVLLKSSDVISALLTQVEQKNDAPEFLAEIDRNSAAMGAKLAQYLGQTKAAAGPQAAPVAAPIEEKPEGRSTTGAWHISLRFGQLAFRNGIDPLSVIDYLRSIGEISHILTITDKLPEFDELDPETCYLGFEISLQTTAAKADIEAAFEFVGDDCTVHLLPPNRRASDFINLMRELPDESRLGDLLVECGAVTRRALDDALSQQQQGASGGDRRGQQPIGKILVEQKKVSTEVVNAALAKQGKTETKSDESRFVRVPADKLDDLISLVGELVICGASASLLAKNLRDEQLIETTQQMSNLVEEIRNGTLGLRMVQIGESFARFRRVVRDTAAELKKEIQLEIEGAETELDKAVVEKISDPLMHLVRNSMDHGIELPAVRIEAGKPAHGTLKLAAHHDSGHIVIRVSDDGRGLDGEKLLAKARSLGLVAPNQVLTEAEKRSLILLPGFSTAEKVTNLSGRGVGMDVVKKNIEALRGSVILKSELGKGTTVEIRLPLTLAIIDGFLVRIGRGSYVIPLSAVVECIDAHADRLHTNGDWAGHIDLRGEVLSFLELRKVFSVNEAVPERRSIVVVRNGDTLAGLVVDQLMGEYQTVIKPLGKLFGQLRGISGSTVMGSGEVALILDVPALVKLATDREERNDEQQTRRAGEMVSAE